MATLTITISEEALASLRGRAELYGCSPEEHLAASVEKSRGDTTAGTVGKASSPPGAELSKLAGILDSDPTDVFEHHDYHLGQSLAHEMRGAPDAPIR